MKIKNEVILRSQYYQDVWTVKVVKLFVLVKFRMI